jgi:competence protein ComEC
VGAVHVTPQFIVAAERDATSLASFVLESLTQRRVAVRRISADDHVQFGSMTWTWLHPPADVDFARDNDSSMVVRIEAGGRRILLCGDIQQDAIGQLMRAGVDVKADVLELPHHGSYLDEAVEFVKVVDADVLMQSTGWTRWQRDRWADGLVNRRRLVTARDGACWVEILPGGEIRTGKFVTD